MSYILKNRLTAALTMFVIGMIPLSILIMSGCAKKLAGDQFSNIPPQVGFINAPPESTNFSRNSVVYWWGTDEDGIIDYFRYHVAKIDDMGGMTPDQYIASVSDANWVIVDVDVVQSQPGTESLIKLSADLNDPVNKFVLQYVFLQAFDEQGASSTIVWRIFGRNDNPPQTTLFNPPSSDQPFVNAVSAGGIITGVKMRWEGSDPIDYPADPPPFDFHYRLYGPYDSLEYIQLENMFFQKRYLTSTGLVFKVGDTIFTCDTVISVSPPDTTITCDTNIIAANEPTTSSGSLQDYFAIDDSLFLNDSTTVNSVLVPSWNRLVDQSKDPFDKTADSIWVQRTADTIFNVFKDTALTPDTTAEMTFVFWVRCRDDALVPDLLPAFKSVRVLNPKYERGILVVDATPVNTPIRNWSNRWFGSVRSTVPRIFWKSAVNAWSGGDPNLDLDTNWIPGLDDQSRDFVLVDKSNGVIPISWMLKHKVIIFYKEGIGQSSTSLFFPNLYKAIDAGVNVWVTARSLGGAGRSQPAGMTPQQTNYARYFGVTVVAYSGWGCHAAGNCLPKFRIEDFIGAYPKAGWPAITVDRNRLRDMIRWAPPSANEYPEFGYDSVAAAYGLPEAGWSVRTFGTELLYRYKSFYGANHPLGRNAIFDYIFEGAPCGHRLNAGLYRTVHTNFTPLVLDSTLGQVMIDSILNWLYDPTLGTAPQVITEKRYPESQVQTSIQEARQNYRNRIEYYEAVGKIEEPEAGSY